MFMKNLFQLVIQRFNFMEDMLPASAVALAWQAYVLSTASLSDISSADEPRRRAPAPAPQLLGSYRYAAWTHYVCPWACWACEIYCQPPK